MPVKAKVGFHRNIDSFCYNYHHANCHYCQNGTSTAMSCKLSMERNTEPES